MKYGQLIFITLTTALLGACAAHQTKSDTKSKSSAPIKVSPVTKTPSAKESVKDEAQVVGIDIVGTPLSGGKFAKLKIGMSLKQVEELIGSPDRQWQQATGADSTPYYNGTDRLLIQSTYKNEGMLTFTSSSEHALIRVLVNRAE
jgi:hypothetical protein